MHTSWRGDPIDRLERQLGGEIIGCSYRVSGFGSEHTHDSLQPSLTQVLGILTPTPDPFRCCMLMMYIYTGRQTFININKPFEKK